MSVPGYMFTGPAGTFEFVGADVTDEVFSHQDFGTLNITRAWKLVPPDVTPIRLDLNQGIVEHLQYRDLDERVLAAMTPARMREPVLSVWQPSGAQLIDGAHRIEKRRQRGMSWFKTFVLVPQAIDACRVRLFRHEKDGSKVEMDTRYGPMGFQPTNGWAPGSGK